MYCPIPREFIEIINSRAATKLTEREINPAIGVIEVTPDHPRVNLSSVDLIFEIPLKRVTGPEYLLFGQTSTHYLHPYR